MIRIPLQLYFDAKPQYGKRVKPNKKAAREQIETRTGIPFSSLEKQVQNGEFSILPHKAYRCTKNEMMAAGAK